MICANFDTFLLAISPRTRGSGNNRGGIAETGTMFGGGWGPLAARGGGATEVATAW